MKLETIGTLFAKSWRRYQERFSTVFLIFLVPLVLIGIGDLLISRQIFPGILLGGILNLLGLIMSLAASIAMVAAVGKNEDFFAAYHTGFKLFWASLWIAILASLAYFGGLILLIIPGIVLIVQLSLVQYVLVLENKNGMMALAQSREYIKGYWWAFVGRALLLGLIYFAIVLVIYLPSKIILGSLVATLVYGIILLVLAPFSVSYSYEIFDNLRRLKPDAAEVAAKAEKGFLKVCMVIGVVGFIAWCLVILFAIAVIGPASIKNQAGYQYTYPPAMGTSTTPSNSY